MKVAFYTLGCKVNQYDTDAMRELFEKAGHQVVNFDEPADVYIINTCTVTAVGDKKSRQMVSRAHALAPEAAIIVAGCYAQSAPEEAAALPGVYAIAGTNERGNIVRMAEDAVAGIKKENITPYNGLAPFESLDVTSEGRTRAFLKIQDGCDRFCSYCIIPYARGPVRSRPLADVKHQLKLLDQAGYKEVVLTGIHLMSYGKDLINTALLDAINAANDVSGIQRIRLGSLEPQLLSHDFVDALRDNEKICRQFHLSLQSGSAGVLKRMNRRYTPEVYASCVESLRDAMPDCAITTDIIVGFPGETEAEFEDTLSFARELKLSRIHVFPYSRRRGTKAYDMPGQVPSQVKKERAARLGKLAGELEREYAQSLIGTVQEVLFEEVKGEHFFGHTRTYVGVEVAQPADTDITGDIHNVHISGVSRGTLEGYIINKIEKEV